MKHLAIALAAVAVLCQFSKAQQHSRGFVEEGKALVSSEARRYASTLNSGLHLSAAGDAYDVTYYRLSLVISTPTPYLRGDVVVSAKVEQDSLSSFVLDLRSSMVVDSVKVAAFASAFSQNDSSVRISLDRTYHTGETITAEVFYEGVPRSSGFGSFAFTSHAGIPWVWSLSEPYGARDWWPCKDHPSDKADSADIIVTCDSSFRVGSNGVLVSVSANGDGTRTHHWKERYPISTYLISVALTNYAQYSNWFKYSSTDSMEVLNYVLPEHLSQAISVTPSTVEGLRIFSDLFGLYPFVKEKYGHSEFGWGGAMEHQTMTTTCCFDEDILIHELSHQWFGDMITCRTWPDIWLNEGFATYCEALFAEKKYGTGSYWSFINGDMSSAKHAVGTVHVQDTANVGRLFDGNLVYSKGGIVLHMLRHVLGDSIFFQAMYSYANTASLRYGTASTPDFQAVCEAVSGKDLHYFFDEWVYGENYPKYIYSWSSSPSSNSYDVTLNIRQTTGTSNPPFFTMPVDVRLVSSGWDTVVTVFNNAQQQVFTFPVSRSPSQVLLDASGWILKDTSLVPVGVLEQNGLPMKFYLAQNYPNPFNPSTEIRYEIPRTTRVRIVVYNLLGMEVGVLVDGIREAGQHSVTWNGQNQSGGLVSAGMYLCEIEAGTYRSAIKMALLK